MVLFLFSKCCAVESDISLWEIAQVQSKNQQESLMDRSGEMKDKRDGDRNDEKWKDAYDDEENMSVWVAGTRSSSVWMSNFICQDTA